MFPSNRICFGLLHKDIQHAVTAYCPYIEILYDIVQHFIIGLLWTGSATCNKQQGE